MTDTDITALVERLRDRHRDQYPTPGNSTVFTQAADALEALQAERDGAISRLSDAQKWIDHNYARAEKAEAENERLREAADKCAHKKFSWEDCEQRAAEAVRARKEEKDGA